MTPLGPAATLGILGGGQLGRMLALEAGRLGFDVHVYCPEADSPAARVAARETVGGWDEEARLAAFAEACEVVTYEFENVPVAAAQAIERAGTPLRPGVASLENSQDRLVEKGFLNRIGIETVAYRAVETRDDLGGALAELGGAAILKRRREGYDGKGQARLSGPADADAAWAVAGGAPCILEALCPFEREVSVIAARGADGAVAVWDPSENDHEGGVLRTARAPARIGDGTAQAARAACLRLIQQLDHVGVLALEFFVTPDGGVLANEFAPRVHNSGHWTPEACLTGQFEQHIRAIAGWPLRSTERVFDAEMTNYLGDAACALPGAAPSGASITLYGKRESAPGRKMAHTVSVKPR
ncbi:MAG: 5-(carboxyamino)imidazole ribonucleotide synthase [Pseudomonadota bacterium]